MTYIVPDKVAKGIELGGRDQIVWPQYLFYADEDPAALADQGFSEDNEARDRSVLAFAIHGFVPRFLGGFASWLARQR